MPKDTDVPGNALASQALLDREINKMGLSLYKVARAFDNRTEDEIVITHLNITGPGAGRADFLGIVKARINDEKVIGFHSGDSLPETLRGLCNRIINGSVQWRKDEPYGR